MWCASCEGFVDGRRAKELEGQVEGMRQEAATVQRQVTIRAFEPESETVSLCVRESTLPVRNRSFSLALSLARHTACRGSNPVRVGLRDTAAISTCKSRFSKMRVGCVCGTGGGDEGAGGAGGREAGSAR